MMERMETKPKRGHRRRRTEDPVYRRKLAVLTTVPDLFTVTEIATLLGTSRDVVRAGISDLTNDDRHQVYLAAGGRLEKQ